MREQFRIKEGGAGNVVSDAQGKGLSQGELLPRNSAVDATPFAPDYEKPLIILYNNRYEEQLRDLLEAFRKKTSYLDDIYAIYDEAYAQFNGASPPSFLIVYAKSAMLNKALIHYNKKPEISADDDGSYRESSGQILKSNGGIVSADVNKQESPCVFYHPFAWQYIVERLEFIATWKASYDGYDIAYSAGRLESSVWSYRSNVGEFFGFAPFGLLGANMTLNNSTVGDIKQTHNAQLDIDGIWEVPTANRPTYHQMREGESYARAGLAPLKFIDDYIPSNVVLSEIDTLTGEISESRQLEYLPIFIKTRDASLKPLSFPLERERHVRLDNNYYLSIAFADGVTSLERLQIASKLKTPFPRNTSLEFASIYDSHPEGKLIAMDILRAWAEANLIPPQMSAGEWWNLFYDNMAYFTDANECGEYSDSDDNLCGVVYETSTSFPLVEHVLCQTEQLPYLSDFNVFRSLDLASDYTIEYGGVQVRANDNFEVGSDVNYLANYIPEIKIRLAMNISSSWTTLPEDVVRASLKRFNAIENVIITDADVSLARLYYNGQEYALIATSDGASIDLAPILESAGIDFDNMPLGDLVDTLRAGFDVVYRVYSAGGSYVGIGARPVKLVNDWRNK